MTDGGHLPSDASLVPPSGQRTDVPERTAGPVDPLTDPLTGPLPGVGLSGGAAWQGEHRPAYTFLDQPDQLDEEDDVLLMPGPQTAWGDAVVHGAVETVLVDPAAAPAAEAVQQQQQQPAPAAEAPATDLPAAGPAAAEPAAPGQPVIETMSLRTVEEPAEPGAAGVPVEPSWPPLAPPLQAAGAVPDSAEGTAQAVRRPLHAGPPIPDPSLMTGHVPVRSLADRGPSGTPAHGIPMPAAEPVPAQPVAVQPQPAAPQQQAPAAAAAPAAEPVPAAVAVAPEQAPAIEPVAATEPVADQAPAVATGTAAPIPAQAGGQPRRISAFLAAPVPHGLPLIEPVAAAEPVAAEPTAVAPVQEAAPTPAEAVAEVEVPAVAVAEAVLAEPALAEPAAAAVQAEPQQGGAAVAAEPVADPSQAPAAADAVAPAEAPAAESAPAVTETVAVAEPVVVAEAAADEQPQPAVEAVPAAQAVVEHAAPEPADAVLAAQQQPAVEQPAVEQPVVEQAAVEQAEPAGEAVRAPAEAVSVAAPEAVSAAAEAPAAEPVPAEPADAVPAPAETTPAEAPAAAAEPIAVAEPAVQPEATMTADTAGTAAPEASEAGPAAVDGAERPPAAPGFDEAGRDAVHQVIRSRRDVRNGFRPDAIPHEVLLRVLEAAHTAPSVGYSQPWDFVVIRSRKTRRKMHELAQRQRDAYADSLPKGRAKQFKEIKIEAILDTPVNIVVTADRTRGGRHTLGRHTQPQMAPYSAALAVENLWLAARAEGLGVGWVSFFDEEEMVRELGLPEHLEVVAYLCVGYVDAFPEEPELQQQGWAKKRPLSWVVHEEQYGNRALPGEEPHSLLADTLRGIRPLDAKSLGDAWDRQKRMTKPAGSLGVLEIIAAQLCGLARKCPPPIPEPGCVAIFAGDHGVHAQGVTPWPQEVTGQMVANFLAGGAVVNSFAAQVGAEVCVVDVGVKAELPDAIQQGRTTGLLPRKVKAGTDDMTQGPAMTREEAVQAIEVGIETARDLVAAGNKVLITGDMGIANTTASAALISVFTGLDPAEVTGRGTGIDDATHARKVEVIRTALALHRPDPADPIGVLSAVGGLEHAAIAGFLLGAASLRTPVILDGVIAGSAALAAKAIAPEALAACIAGHRSAEPGHQAALGKLGLRPLIDLDLRLGEGTGALLALPLVQSAARAMHDVATFDSAGVTEKA
ncbi:nicotinate-nucleotide--dimethylbenzimidazole phosphoribosyltransferase [Kitasatospora sp. NPDC059571]|uniref:nicotinate-nucleotide--dimethylbenzimidazole phosphoribosyltransferase n=1 Tax=Kitasatospora sp. NPDC059571 TaxID=3346871 RepID=UPI0036785640